MARNWEVLVIAFLVSVSICESAIFHPVSESHRSAALELFSTPDGSFSSLEETYEALRTFEVLGIEKSADIRTPACGYVLETLQSTTSDLKEIFHALRSNGILKCDLKIESLQGFQSRLENSLNGANTLLDFYYTIGGLVLLKVQTPGFDLQIVDGDRILRSIKALSQSDGKWRHSPSNTESSIVAAGIALEAVAGVISLAASEIDHSLIASLKTDVLKLFDGVERYDDGAYYFEEKPVDARGDQGPLSTTASVVRGITAFAAVAPESLNLPGDKILGLARFFLGIGIPGSAKDLFYQIDALACLDNIRGSIPLILSLPATVISVTRKEQVKVKVTTVLSSSPPNLSVKLVQIFTSGSKDGSVINQNLKYDPENEVHVLEVLPALVDIGNYIFSFEIIFDDREQKRNYATGGRTKVPIYITGVVDIKDAEIAILDNDIGSVETQKKLNLPGENAVTLSANHLQKMRLSFQLSTSSENAFKPQQVFLKLTHESRVEHIFVVGNSGKNFATVLDFLGLVEKLYYLSGRYEIQLTVGDSVMENSFLQPLGYIELDLPDPPEKAARPPPQSVDPYSRYGPKAEISHIFRSPEKRPPRWLSITFSVLVCVPFVGFLGSTIFLLRANLKNFPKASSLAAFALLFHLGIAAVLLLYVAFWFKLDLFTTLKALGLLGAFLMFVGHRTLSHHASISAKLKSS